jgi:hypothetical protein
MEYRRLTFTQVISIHRKFAMYLNSDVAPLGGVSSELPNYSTGGDYTSLVDTVLLKKGNSFDRDSSAHSLLSLVEVYCSHGYHQEADATLQESIRLAQEEKRPDVLKETMAWVIELNGGSKEMKTKEALLSLLEGKEVYSDLNAESVSSHFELWSKLKLCKERLISGESPISVIDAAMAGLTAAFQPGIPGGMKMAATSLIASCWDHLGYRTVGQLYCGLTCYMSSRCGGESYSLDSGHSLSNDVPSECNAHCISSISQYLFDQVSHFFLLS